MNLDKKLIKVGIAAIMVYALYIFFGPTHVTLPLADYTKEEALIEVTNELAEVNLPIITEADLYYTDVIAYSSVGRYIEANAMSEEEVAALEEEVTLYSYEVATPYLTYQYDLKNKQLTKAENIYLELEGEEFVHQYFGEAYNLVDEVGASSFFDIWTVKQTYEAPTSINTVTNVVDLYLEGHAIIGFEKYGLASQFPEAEESLMQMLAGVFILLFLLGLLLFVTIHLIIKVVKKEIEAFWEPLALTIVAAIGWLFVNKAMGINLFSVATVEYFMMIYLTFTSLLIRWQKDSRPLATRVASLQPAVVHALFLMVIAQLLAEGFFYLASFFDTWVSPVSMHNVFIELNIWYIPIFTLFIGLCAAITEESIFRHYLVPIFGRFGVVTALLATSFLWGIMHIGYDMYPWYIYVLEFIVISGPFFFFVYKKYGFATAIFMHYFYNAFVTVLFVLSIDIKVALVSWLVMLSPFLLLLVKEKEAWQET